MQLMNCMDCKLDEETTFQKINLVFDLDSLILNKQVP